MAEIGLAALLVVFIKSPGPITAQHRLALVSFAISLVGLAWAASRSPGTAGGERLWLLLAAGFLLSLSVKGENLTRPPSWAAAQCCIVIAIAAALSLAPGRKSWRGTGFEAALAASAVFLLAVSAMLFRPVAAQNSLDTEVLHNTWGTLFDYILLLAGISITSVDRGSRARMALLMALACSVKLLWRHGAAAG